jgi:hypothetical protein
MTAMRGLIGLFAAGVMIASAGRAAETAERTQLRAQRQAIEADYAAREQACLKQFVVTPCVEQVRLDKLGALEGIRKRENAIDDAERLKRAQAQEQRLAEKADAAARAASALSEAASRPRRSIRSLHGSNDSGQDGSHPPKARPVTPVAENAEKEQRKRAEFGERQREIKAHRDEVERRNAERAARKKTPPIPLPLPAGASTVR